MADYPITLFDSTVDEVNEIVSALDGLSDDIEIKVISSKGFVGIDEITLFISALGGGVLVKQFATIIVVWMKRHEGRKVKLGKLEITGYSVEEVERILRAVNAK